MKRQTIIDTISLLFILLFVYAAASKLIEYEKFHVQLAQSPLLTDISGFIAWFIPTIELIISVALSLPRYQLAGLYASFGLMTAFSAYIYILSHYSDNIPCSCGGVLAKMSWNQHFIFNLVFVALAALAVIMSRPLSQQLKTVIA